MMISRVLVTPLELLLVCVVKFIHTLGEGAVHQMVAAGIPCGCLMYHGDDLTKECELLVL